MGWCIDLDAIIPLCTVLAPMDYSKQHTCPCVNLEPVLLDHCSMHDGWNDSNAIITPRDFCWSHSEDHCACIWDCCLSHLEGGTTSLDKTFSQRREKLAEIMLGILPPALGGDIRDWERGDESETKVHNMVSTSVVHSNRMPINLSHLAMLLPCSTYDRKRFAAITIRIDNPRCTALLFTSGKLVITGVKSW